MTTNNDYDDVVDDHYNDEDKWLVGVDSTTTAYHTLLDTPISKAVYIDTSVSKQTDVLACKRARNLQANDANNAIYTSHRNELVSRKVIIIKSDCCTAVTTLPSSQ